MKYGLIGERLGHSFSKDIHSRLGGYEYELREIKQDKLDAFMRERDFLGINVTLPYKQRVMPYLDWISEHAKKIGAVNTIINQGGKLYGYNTDFYGLKSLIMHAGIDPKGKKAAILGSGGTSKTAMAVLEDMNAGEILRVSRGGGDGLISYEMLKSEHKDVEIIINTTPVGMFPDVFGCVLDISEFSALKGVIDVVYNPMNTTIVQSARERGIKAEGGLYMLVGQAAVASELFLNEKGSSNPNIIDEIYRNIKAESENIVLIGMPSSGKSTVGKILAERLGRKFIDTDELITEKIGMSIKSYFEINGEEAFRVIETEVIRDIASEIGAVIATGGGAILKKENISALKYNGNLTFIDRPIEMLCATDSRPLSSDEKSLRDLYERRYEIYLSACDNRVDGSVEAEEVAEKIMENYK